jgi:hypothetical protein
VSKFPTRKGYRAVAVDFRGERPRVIQWERIEKTAQDDHIADPGKKVGGRGVLAAERGDQGDLFGGD